MSSKLVCVSDNTQFAGIEPEEGCYDNIWHCALLCQQDNVEMNDLVSAHPVIVSPWSVAGNQPLHGLGSQQPWQKDHRGYIKNDAYSIAA